MYTLPSFVCNMCISICVYITLVKNLGREIQSDERERERKVTRARDETQPGGKEMPRGESTQREPQKKRGGWWCSRL
jgi:hypothetical protein